MCRNVKNKSSMSYPTEKEKELEKKEKNKGFISIKTINV
jgi:hypothetical protein